MSAYHNIYCHGWGSGPSVWNYIAERPVRAPTFRDISCPDAFLPALTGVIPQQPHILIAWSLGGILAQAYAAQKPALLRALVLIGSTPKFTSNDRQKGWPRAIVQQMLQRLSVDPEKTVRDFQTAMFSGSERQALKSYRAMFSGAEHVDFNHAALCAGLEYLSEADMTDQLNKIDCPTLWIHGRDDAICPAGCLDGTPPNHEKVVLEGCGHVPHWSRPDDVRAVIREFTNGL